MDDKCPCCKQPASEHARVKIEQAYVALAEGLQFAIERKMVALEASIRTAIEGLPLDRCQRDGCANEPCFGSAFCQRHYDEVCGASRLLQEYSVEPRVEH